MAMPVVPGAGLAMVKAEIVLRPLEAFLDGPSQTGGAGELGEGCAGRPKDEIAGSFVGGVAGAAEQQPVRRDDQGETRIILIVVAPGEVLEGRKQ